MDIVAVLMNVGLSKNEAEVYLALLRVESSMAGSLAHTTKRHRACVYDALGSLECKGLVSVTVVDGKKHFKAMSAESLVDFVGSKKTQLENVLPEIKRISAFKEQKSNTYLFEGIFALKEAMTGLLSEGEEILMWGVPENINENILLFIESFNKEREEFKIPARYIYTSKDEEWMKKISKFKNTEVRYFSWPESRVSVAVSGKKTVMIVWSEPVLVSVMENEHVADFHKKEFEVLWKGGKVS